MLLDKLKNFQNKKDFTIKCLIILVVLMIFLYLTLIAGLYLIYCLVGIVCSIAFLISLFVYIFKPELLYNNNKPMILDKFKNRFSYNFLAIYGWAKFLFLSFNFTTEIFYPEAAHAMAIITTMIFVVDLIFILLTFFIYLFERLSSIRITNEKFLNNKLINITQHIGFILFALPFLAFLCFFILLFSVSFCSIK